MTSLDITSRSEHSIIGFLCITSAGQEKKQYAVGDQFVLRLFDFLTQLDDKRVVLYARVVSGQFSFIIATSI